jgi:NADH:ubiquinone oxidoreductase subunit 2 (subunit N)
LDIGFSLITIGLAIGSNTDIYRVLFFTLLLPRGLSFGVLALALSGLMGRIEVLDLENIRGLGKSYPVISISIILSIFCIAGMPLTAGFPLKLSVIEGLSVNVPQISLWVIIGSLGLIAGGIRMLFSMVSDADEIRDESSEPRGLRTFLVIGVAILFILGILPNFFIQFIINLPAAFGPVVP